jgi:hypothetical protein
MQRRTATFLLTGALAWVASACPPAPAGTDGGPEVVSVSDEVTARVDVGALQPLGAGIPLDGSDSAHEDGRALVFAWSVTPPDGCEGSLEDADAPIATFVAGCTGAHTAELVVETLDGQSAQASGNFDVVEVEVRIGSLVSAPYGESAEVDVQVLVGGEPTDLVAAALEALPRTDGGDVPAITGDGAPFYVPMLAPHETYDLTATGVVDGRVVSPTAATGSITADNNPPVIDMLVTEDTFEAGGDVAVHAVVSDADGDDVGCYASIISGDETGITVDDDPADSCRFIVHTPTRLEQWTLQVTATDSEGDDVSASVTLQPENLAPVIDGATGPTDEPHYTCDTDGCATATFEVAVSASDDFDTADTLIYDVDGLVGAPDGFVVTSEASTTVAGLLSVTLSRPGLGAFAGDYTLRLRATESATADGMPASTTREHVVTVTSEPPSVVSLDVQGADHGYAGPVDGYVASPALTALADDPEGNLVSSTLELISCPEGAAGTAACGGVDLSIATTVVTDGLLLELAALEMADLVGSYTVRITTTDADGVSVTSDRSFEVENRRPLLGTATTLSPTWGGAEWSARLPVYSEADGDPLTDDLQVRCPGAGLITPPGFCGATSVSIDDGELVLETTDKNDRNFFLGQWEVVGSVSDALATLGTTGQVLITHTVQLGAPDATFVSRAITCDHETTGAAVSNASGCRFRLTLFVDGPDGPLHARLVDPVDGWDYNFGGTAPTLVNAANNAIEYDVDLSWSRFVSDFGQAPKPVTVRITNDFGEYEGEFVESPVLLNREVVWGNGSALAAPADHASGHAALWLDGGSAGAAAANRSTNIGGLNFIAGRTLSCIGGGACTSAWAPVRVTLDVTDPDGDPIQSKLNLTCDNGSGPVFVSGGTAQGVYFDHSPGPMDFGVDANIVDCGGSTQAQLPIHEISAGSLTYGFTCNLSVVGTYAHDSLGTGSALPSSVVRSYQFDGAPIGGVCQP